MCSNVNEIENFVTTGNGSLRKCEKPQLSLVCLNDDVLLNVFSFLDWIDSIHFSETCVRLRQLNFWRYKKGENFVINEYKRKGKIPLDKVLTTFGPHISVLTINHSDISEDVMANCLNLKSLRIPYDLTSSKNIRSAAINEWIKQLKLESIWFEANPGVQHILDGVTNLKELYIKNCGFETDIPNFLERNANVERLAISIRTPSNYRVFSKLQNLRSLHICDFYFAYQNLDEIMEFGTLDKLTEFSISCYNGRNYDKLNSNLKKIAEVTSLDKLNIAANDLNDDTFRVLKLFNLTSLSLNTQDYLKDYSSDKITQFILEDSAPRLKHLKLSHRSNQKIMALAKILVEKCKKLERICFACSEGEKLEEFDEIFFNKLLSISTTRPPLMVDIHPYPGIYMKRTILVSSFHTTKFQYN